MLRTSTRKAIKSHKLHKHTNKSQLYKRIKDQSHDAIDDLTLIATELDDERLQDVFTKESVEKLISALLKNNKDSTKLKMTKTEKNRIFSLGSMFINQSLGVTGRMIENQYAQELYKQHEIPMKRLLRALYNERFEK